jgi:hypothetical protein
MVAENRIALVAEIEPDEDLDSEELAELTQRLRGELVGFDVEDVRLAAGEEAPAGAKGLELLGVGGLIVDFMLSADVLKSIVGGVSAWVGRQRARSVKLTLAGDTLEVTGISSADQTRLIEQWVARHASAG